MKFARLSRFVLIFLIGSSIFFTSIPTIAVIDPGQLVNTAKKYLGYPYHYGGASPRGFDCSGFTVFIFKKLGKELPRNEWQMYAAGKPVKKKDLKTGDILFFVNTYRRGLSHIGIYIGGNKFIHAAFWPLGVRVDSLSHPYYAARYYSACRIPEFFKKLPKKK